MWYMAVVVEMWLSGDWKILVIVCSGPPHLDITSVEMISMKKITFKDHLENTIFSLRLQLLQNKS